MDVIHCPKAELLQLRARLGFAAGMDCPKPSMVQCLTPSQRSRFDKFMAKANEATDKSKPFIGDIAQNPRFTKSGPDVPTNTQNMILYDFVNDHFMTSTEMFASQGHPVAMTGPASRVGGLEQGSSLAWRSVYTQLGRKDRLSLLGNGQHMSSTGAFSLWLLSNLVHVDDLDFNFDCIGEHRLADGCIEVVESPHDDVSACDNGV